MRKISTLPESELEVMLALWQFDAPQRTARILEAVANGKSWTLSTLKVLLARLEQKGFLKCVREGRFTLYEATVTREAYSKKETKGLLSRYYENSAKHMIAALVQAEGLSQEDLAELADILARAGEQNDC